MPSSFLNDLLLRCKMGFAQSVSHSILYILDYCVGDYFEKSREATELVLAKKSVPILVGGTGMYLRWCDIY